MHYAYYAACMCNMDVNTYAPQEWVHAAEKLHWEYNNTGRFHPEYHGYVPNSYGEYDDEVYAEGGFPTVCYGAMGCVSCCLQWSLHEFGNRQVVV